MLLRNKKGIRLKSCTLFCKQSSYIALPTLTKDTKLPLISKFFSNVKYDVPSIKEMKQLIIKSLDLDRFVKLQNGDLITSFANTEIDIDINKYKNTKLCGIFFPWRGLSKTARHKHDDSQQNNSLIFG